MMLLCNLYQQKQVTTTWNGNTTELLKLSPSPRHDKPNGRDGSIPRTGSVRVRAQPFCLQTMESSCGQAPHHELFERLRYDTV
jgi:hypothetical protein